MVLDDFVHILGVDDFHHSIQPFVDNPFLPQHYVDKYSYAEEFFQPAKLDALAYEKMLNKQIFCAHEPVDFVVDDFYFAVDSVVDLWVNKIGPQPMTSLEDALKSCDGNSSAGFPWTLLPGVTTKKELLKSKHSKVFYDWLLRFPKALLEGGFCSAWSIFLKGELRPTEKVVNHVSRGISCSDFVTLLWHKVFASNQHSAVYDYCYDHDFPSTLGCTPFYGGWNRLHAKAFQFGCEKAWCYDFSSWDSRMRPHMHLAYSEITHSCLDTDGYDNDFCHNVLEALLDQTLYPLIYHYGDNRRGVLSRGGFFHTPNQKSGGYATAMANTSGHEVALRYAMIDAPTQDYGSLVYSDDGLHGCPDANIDYCRSIGPLRFRDLGVVAEPQVGDDYVIDADDGEFLSATFRDGGGQRVFEPVNLEKFLASSLLMKKSSSVVEQFSKVCALRTLCYGCDIMAFRELSEVARGLLSTFPELDQYKGCYLTQYKLDELYYGYENPAPHAV
jgi:hypothetical protein